MIIIFKKILLFILLVLFFSNLFAVSDSIKIAEKDKNFFKVNKVKPPFPLCKKVFPGVEYYVKLYLLTTPPGKTYYGKYNGKYYYLVNEYSTLFKQVKNESNATLFERIKLLLQLYYMDKVDSINVSDFKPLGKEKKEKLKKSGIMDFGYNYQAKVKIVYKLKYRGISELIAYIKIKNNIIEFIDFFTNKGHKAGVIVPLSFNYLDIPEVRVIDGNYYYENVDGRDYYYIKVSNNGVTTGDSITFQIINLEPNEENVKLILYSDVSYNFLNRT